MIKRLIDIVGAGLLLLLLAPLMVILAISVRLALGKPFLFRQHRPGYRGQPFALLKFRTMLDSRDESGELRADAERLTRFGRWLRRTSLDELPELINVLKGEMSLVGPRPLLMEYLPLYTQEQQRRHEVRPGITGWAQINGRNAISWEEKFALDVWYVDHQSIALDLRVLFATLGKVVDGRDVSQSGHATMQKFRGSSTG